MIKVKGLFAVSLIAILMAGGVAVNSAVAAIASKGYVDQVAATHVQSSEQTPNAILTTDADGNVQATAQITQSQVDGLTGALNAKADTTDIPTKTSQLNNDSGFITSGDLPGEYELPVATADTLGGVKSGGDITVGTDGAVTVNSATKADSATTAASATKATQDASGNVITSTYATKTELSAKQNASTAVEVATAGTAVGDSTHPVYVNANGVATKIDKVAAAAKADTATTATNDADGNEITETYATKTDLGTKADAADIPTKTSQLTNDSGFVTSSTVSNTYATKAQITALDSTSNGTGAVVTAVSQTDGKVSVTRGNVKIPVGGENAMSYATIWIE